MSGVAHLSSEGYVGGGNVTSAVTPTFPSEDTYTHVHTILIVIVFCIVCFLLLVAFFYAFCFYFTLQTSPKDGQKNSSCSLDREDATFRRSSSSPSLGNTIWGRLQILFVCFSLLMYFSSLYLFIYLFIRNRNCKVNELVMHLLIIFKMYK